MKKKIIASIMIIVTIVCIGVLIKINKTRNKIVTVKTAEVMKGDLEAYLSNTGTVKAQEIKEYYGVQAKVNKVNVNVGNIVKKGDVLVIYDVQDLNIPVKQAQIQYNNAILQKQDLINQNDQIVAKIQEKNNDITEIESKINTIDSEIEKLGNNPSVLEQLQTLKTQRASYEQQKNTLIQQRDSIQVISNEKLKQSDNAVTLAKLNLDTANQNLSKNKNSIESSINGVVTAVNVSEGSMGTVSQPALIVQNLENLKVIMSVSKYDAYKVKLNQSAVIKGIDNKYEGKVSNIAPVAERAKTQPTGEPSLTIEISILDKNPNLKVEFDADVDILIDEVKNVIKIPGESIKTDKKGRNYVYTLKDNKVSEREIKIGIQSDREAQVINGLKVGEKVILNPTSSIKDGILAKEVSK